MATRLCAKRAHQIAASVLSNGVGPSRLPGASVCRCHIVATPSTYRAPRTFSTSTYLCEESPSSGPAETQGTGSESTSKKSSIGLLAGEDANAEPTLEYLDSLKPRARHHPRDQQHPRRNSANPFAKSSSSKKNAEDKIWERTRARLNASFTRDQLATLARAAKLPGSYARAVKKDDIVRRIMVHRFGMEDARERVDREKRDEVEKRAVHISFRPAELYLLLARGSGKVRQEAGKSQVAILSQPPSKEKGQQGTTSDKLGFWIKGKDQGIARMTEWVEDFKQSIKIKEEEVVLSAEPREVESTEAGLSEVLPAELVRFISQLSRCFMEASPIQHGKVSLSLAYLDERDAQKAVLLLRHYHAESVRALHRIGAAAYRDNVGTTRQCSMLPFVPNEPTPWIQQADDLLYGAHSDISFRVSHVPELNAFSMLSSTKLPTMKLHGWTHQGEVQFAEPFRALADSAIASASSVVSSSSASDKDIECTAELGHVLFNPGGLTLADEGLTEQEMLSRLQDPLAAPLAGMWPIGNALDWAQRFRARFGREASRFVPATLFRSQKNISLDIWLERLGYALASSGANETATEQVVLVYQPAETGYLGQGTKLEIVLTRHQSEADVAEGAKGGWTIQQARWASEAQGDMMVPEKGADLRLSAKTLVPLEEEALAAIQSEMASYLSSAPAAASVPCFTASAAEKGEEAVEDGETEVNDILGSETEVVERSPTSVKKATSLATHAGALPPSLLEFEFTGKLALESVTRSTVETYIQRSALPDTASRPSAAAEPQSATANSAAEAPSAVPADTVEQASIPSEAETIASTPITTTEAEAEAATATSEATAAEGPSSSLSPVLIREISQDLVTKNTSESLRITWRLSSPHQVPQWSSVVEPISALLDRYDVSIH
ncbi:hypothetical protein EX895_000819 [Sporisorium graminicola]|uniref:Uncharacterized protein n=1 Tax=Sporisorium graminicola TaxID=280036 RepID=A0A4U7L0R8_9BASI|nr:hypothetical protein EX895_000819 [Sporisorium graminicola]TKY90821.1 hypothetical protein EX895_000819 [Sporisorium graminicola]